MIAELSFVHPVAGALALLGIPAVVAIHCLQLPSRPQRVSTLFLLERLEPESRGGRRMRRLRQSVPFWLQLLAVLLIAWLLAEPRWVRPDSAQTVLVVLDSSVSMRAFAEPLRERLPGKLRQLAEAAGKTEWLLMESDPAAGRLYSGARLEDLQAALANWKPRLGSHDALPALRLAQSLVRDRGVVVYVTDRPAAVPPGVETIAIGQRLENAGFCGVRASREGWEALVRNYGTRPQRRRWWIEDKAGRRIGDGPGSVAEIALEAGASQALRGRFPDGGTEGITLVLEEGDGFALDDRLPVVRPEPKRLRVRVAANATGLEEWLNPLLNSTEALDRLKESANSGNTGSAEERPDLSIIQYDPLVPRPPRGDRSDGPPAMVFVRAPASASKLRTGMVVAERAPLVEGLSWDGLLAAEGFGIPTREGDEVLVWQGERSLIARRGANLLVGFDPALSNAPRLPAFVLLLHRFMESVREGVVGREAGNVEVNQRMHVASAGGRLEVIEAKTKATKAGGNRAEEAALLRAPEEPGFFEVREGETVRYSGAAHFADARESDFREAGSADSLAGAALRQRERHSKQDGLAPFWALLLGAVMIGNWAWQDRRRGG